MTNDRSDPWRIGSVKTIMYCTLCVAVVGLILLIAGAVLTGIAYTEVRPNMADENYDRYIKANSSRVVGPIMLAFGLLCIIGGCIFFTITAFSSSKTQYANHNLKYNVKSSVENIPSANEKMLSTV